MQKLFYIVCRWLEEDNSRQSEEIASIIKTDMEMLGIKYDDIAYAERQR